MICIIACRKKDYEYAKDLNYIGKAIKSLSKVIRNTTMLTVQINKKNSLMITKRREIYQITLKYAVSMMEKLEKD